MGFMEFLQEASKNDLIDIIISLQSQLGEEITEERFARKNKWPLVQTFISLEDSVHCGHAPNVPDIGVVRTLKEFFRRCQNDTETFKEYLDNVKKLATEAGLRECERLFDRYVVARVLAGVSDSSLRDDVLSKSKDPKLKDLEEICNYQTESPDTSTPLYETTLEKGSTQELEATTITTVQQTEITDPIVDTATASSWSGKNDGNAFDLLLQRNVPHIWEKIFLSLDYASFRNCLRLSHKLSSVLQDLKSKSTFIDPWLNNSSLKRNVWKSGMNIVNWTAGSGEVAFVERNGSSKILHLIDAAGKMKSGRLRFREGPNSTKNVFFGLELAWKLVLGSNVFFFQEIFNKQT